MKRKPLAPNQLKVFSAIVEIAKETKKPVTVEQICQHLQVGDKMVRDSISNLRSRHYIRWVSYDKGYTLIRWSEPAF